MSTPPASAIHADPRDADLGPAVLRQTLSRQLARLAAGFVDRPVRFGELIDVLQLRGYNSVLLFLALPFVAPVPLPGFSTFFGIVIALLGLRMALAQSPGVPECLRARELPPRVSPKLLLLASRLTRRLEKLLRPRWLYPEFPGALQRASGALIMACGCLLLLPLPVPFSNAFPALTVVLLAAAGLERDGLVFVLGCGQFLLCLGFFGFLILGGSEVWQHFQASPGAGEDLPGPVLPADAPRPSL